MSYEYSSLRYTFIEREFRFQEIRLKMIEDMLVFGNYSVVNKGNGIFNSIQQPKWVRLEKFKESVKNYKV